MVDDVVERIRKLLRLAGNEGATEAEAASALEKANTLLIRHNLTMDTVAMPTETASPVTEERIHTGWAGSWRGSLLGILARHNFCSPIISRRGKTDTIVVVGRSANVAVTHEMYDWIANQLEQLALEEWAKFNREQRAALAEFPDTPWCPECEDWTGTYRETIGYHGGAALHCEDCDTRMLLSRPLVHGFSWKTGFFRGALLRIGNRLYEQRKAQEQPTRAQSSPTTDAPDGAAVMALVVRTKQENEDYIAKNIGRTVQGRSTSRDYHASAWRRGQERGGDVNLAPQRKLGSDRQVRLP